METTKQAQYYILRDTVLTANVDTDLTSAQKDWDYFAANLTESDGYSKEIPSSANFVQIIFDHLTANTHTATAIIYAVKDKGPVEYVCSANLLAGAQETSGATPRYYCDTIGDSTWVDRWPKAVGLSDNSGNNGVAKINFDALGAKHIICLFTAISAGSSVRAKITWG